MAGQGYVSSDPGILEQGIEEAKRNGLFGHWAKRSGMKLPSNATKIAICIPMGLKDDPDVFQCPKCETRSAGSEIIRSAGLAPIEFAMNMQQLVPPLLASVHYFFRKSVPSAQAREEMTHEAMSMGAKYIFYWDDDTLLPPHTIYDLHNMMERTPDAGIISGVYVTRQDCAEPLVYKRHGEGAYWDFCAERGVLEPIFGAGAGCMIARVEALRDIERIMGRPFWDDEYTDSATSPDAVRQKDEPRHMWGHDIRFCRRMHVCGDHYKPDADPGYLSKAGAVEKARNEIGQDVPLVGIRADELVAQSMEDRKAALIEAGSAQMPWEVYLAGWIQCGHFDVRSQKVFTLPADAPCHRNSNTRGYWDHQARKEAIEASQGFGQIRGSTGWLHPWIEARIPERSKVVDLGCYTGDLGDRLIKRKGVQYKGFDISEEAIRQLKVRHMEGMALDLGELNLHGITDEEIVTCLEVLEHLDDERLRNVVKELGKFSRAIVSVPSEKLREDMLPTKKEHVREFTPDSLRELLRTKFEDVVVTPVDPHFLVALCRKEAIHGPRFADVQERDEPLHVDGRGEQPDLGVDHRQQHKLQDC